MAGPSSIFGSAPREIFPSEQQAKKKRRREVSANGNE
jgi:hypothetical protein